MGIRKMLEILVIFGGDKGDKGVKANSSDYKTSTKVLAFIYRSGATISL
jgi:hypothetical protein